MLNRSFLNLSIQEGLKGRITFADLPTPQIDCYYAWFDFFDFF